MTLASRFIQLKRLHSSLDLSTVLNALNEVLVNVVGTEDFALFLFDDESTRFEKLYGLGSRAAALSSFAANEEPAAVSALIRLRSGTSYAVLGIVVITQLLPHKPGLCAHDRSLLADLADHAGIAIEAALLARKASCRPLVVREVREQILLPTLATERFS
jgi:hypothetical protein